MNRPLRLAIAFLCVVLLAVPVSLVTTYLLVPLWGWIEAVAGIESLGHSGPAEWCYGVVFAVWVVLGWLGVWLGRRRT